MIRLLAAETQLENGTVIWERALQKASNGLYKMTLKQELNKASTLELTVSQENPYYDQFTLYSTRLTLVDDEDDTFFFHGRVNKIKTDVFGQKTITAESFLAYLADGVYIAAETPDEQETYWVYRTGVTGQTDHWEQVTQQTYNSFQGKKAANKGVGYWINENNVWRAVDKGTYDDFNGLKEQRKAGRVVDVHQVYETVMTMYRAQKTGASISDGDFLIQNGTYPAAEAKTHEESNKDGSGDLLSKLNDECIKYHGGYLRERITRRQGGGYTLYLDYIESYNRHPNQVLEFGKQISSIDREDNSKEFFTTLVALGDNYTVYQWPGPTPRTAHVPVTNGDGTPGTVDVQILGPYLDILPAMQLAGTRIIHMETFSGLGGTKEHKDPNSLYEPALNYITNNYKPDLMCYKVKAVDMHLLNPGEDRILLGDVVQVIPSKGASVVTLTCTAVDRDFMSLENTTFTIGVPDQTLTQKYANTESASKKTGRRASANTAAIDEISDTFDVHKRRISLIADESLWAGMANKSAFFEMNDNGEITVNAKSILTAADYLLTEIKEQDLELVRSHVANSDGSETDTIYQKIFGKNGIGFFGESKTQSNSLHDLIITNKADIGANTKKFDSYYYANEVDEKWKSLNDAVKALENKEDLRWSAYESELQQTAQNIHGVVQRTVKEGVDEFSLAKLSSNENPSTSGYYEFTNGQYVRTSDTQVQSELDVTQASAVTMKESSNPHEMGLYELVDNQYRLTDDTQSYVVVHNLYHPPQYNPKTGDNPKVLCLYEAVTTVSGGETIISGFRPSTDETVVPSKTYYKYESPKGLGLYELNSQNKYVLTQDVDPVGSKLYYVELHQSNKTYYRIPEKQKAYYRASSLAKDLGVIRSGFDILHDSYAMFSQATGVILDEDGVPIKDYVETTVPSGGNPAALGLYEKQAVPGSYVFTKDQTMVSGKTYYQIDTNGYFVAFETTTPNPQNAQLYELAYTYVPTTDTTAQTGKKYYSQPQYRFDQNSANTIISKIGTDVNKAYMFAAINGENIAGFDSNGNPIDSNGNAVKNYVSFASVTTDATGDVIINALNNQTNDGTLKVNANRLNLSAYDTSAQVNTKIQAAEGKILLQADSSKSSAKIVVDAINSALKTGESSILIQADRLNLAGYVQTSNVNFVLDPDTSNTASSVAGSINATGVGKFAYLDITGRARFDGNVGIGGALTTSNITFFDNDARVSGNFLSAHYHRVTAEEQFTGSDENRVSTGQVKITIGAPTMKDAAGWNTDTFNIASTTYFINAIAEARSEAAQSGAAEVSVDDIQLSNISVGTYSVNGSTGVVTVPISYTATAYHDTGETDENDEPVLNSLGSVNKTFYPVVTSVYTGGATSNDADVTAAAWADAKDTISIENESLNRLHDSAVTIPYGKTRKITVSVQASPTDETMTQIGNILYFRAPDYPTISSGFTPQSNTSSSTVSVQPYYIADGTKTNGTVAAVGYLNLTPSGSSPANATMTMTGRVRANNNGTGTTYGVASKDITLSGSDVTVNGSGGQATVTASVGSTTYATKTVNISLGTVTWNTATITNSNGTSSVTAKCMVGGVEIGSQLYTGTYATADSDNLEVRSGGWTAAYGQVVLPNTESSSSSFVVKTPNESETSNPVQVSTTYLFYDPNSWGSNHKKYIYIQNDTTEKNVARYQVDATDQYNAGANNVGVGGNWVGAQYTATATNQTKATPSSASTQIYHKFVANSPVDDKFSSFIYHDDDSVAANKINSLDKQVVLSAQITAGSYSTSGYASGGTHAVTTTEGSASVQAKVGSTSYAALPLTVSIGEDYTAHAYSSSTWPNNPIIVSAIVNNTSVAYRSIPVVTGAAQYTSSGKIYVRSYTRLNGSSTNFHYRNYQVTTSTTVGSGSAVTGSAATNATTIDPGQTASVAFKIGSATYITQNVTANPASLPTNPTDGAWDSGTYTGVGVSGGSNKNRLYGAVPGTISSTSQTDSSGLISIPYTIKYATWDSSENQWTDGGSTGFASSMALGYAVGATQNVITSATGSSTVTFSVQGVQVASKTITANVPVSNTVTFGTYSWAALASGTTTVPSARGVDIVANGETHTETLYLEQDPSWSNSQKKVYAYFGRDGTRGVEITVNAPASTASAPIFWRAVGSANMGNGLYAIAWKDYDAGITPVPNSVYATGLSDFVFGEQYTHLGVNVNGNFYTFVLPAPELKLSNLSLRASEYAIGTDNPIDVYYNNVKIGTTEFTYDPNATDVDDYTPHVT